MVKILKFLGYFFFFLLALMFFMPKVSAYYYAEQELHKHQVILSNEEIEDKGLSLSVNNIDVSFQAIETAKIESFDAKLFLVYNTLTLKNIELASIAASFFPVKVDNVTIKYTLLNPLKIVAHSSGEFGEAKAEVHLLDRNASALIKPSKLMLQKHRKTLSMMKKQANGEYAYVKTF